MCSHNDDNSDEESELQVEHVDPEAEGEGEPEQIDQEEQLKQFYADNKDMLNLGKGE